MSLFADLSFWDKHLASLCTAHWSVSHRALNTCFFFFFWDCFLLLSFSFLHYNWPLWFVFLHYVSFSFSSILPRSSMAQLCYLLQPLQLYPVLLTEILWLAFFHYKFINSFSSDIFTEISLYILMKSTLIEPQQGWHEGFVTFTSVFQQHWLPAQKHVEYFKSCLQIILLSSAKYQNITLLNIHRVEGSKTFYLSNFLSSTQRTVSDSLTCHYEENDVVLNLYNSQVYLYGNHRTALQETQKLFLLFVQQCKCD